MKNDLVVSRGHDKKQKTSQKVSAGDNSELD